MTSASHSRSGSLAARWGHFAPQLLMISIGAVIVLGLHPIGDPLTGLAVSVALVGFVLVSWVFMRRHDRGLCEHCMASMPLNASEQALRYKRRFWASHTGMERRFLIPYVAVLIGSNFFPGTTGRIAWAVIQTSMIYLILSHSTHRRLQPWCPWCREGGGGNERIDAPEPLPDNSQLV